MKRILVLGANGMLGHVVYFYFKKLGTYLIKGVDKSALNKEIDILDVSDFLLLEEYIKSFKPNIIINCIGILVKESNFQIDVAILLNSYLPNLLSKLGRKLNYKLIHVSTDCVFSGQKGNYKDNDFRDGDTMYARTKALGEVVNDIDLTVRTSIIGPELTKNGTGLLDWAFKQKRIVNGYSNVYWSGVTTLELSKIFHKCIEQNITGLYQVCSSQKGSKYDLLLLIKEIWSLDQIQIKSYDSYASDKSLVSIRTDFNYTC